MEILEIIRHRRSIRKYTTDLVPTSMLDCIIEAGRFAPSGGNSQTTHFLVVQNPQILQLLRTTAAEEFAKMEIREGMYRSLVSSIRLSQHKGTGYDFTYGAPVLILLSNKRGYGNAMADCALAAENMFLQATALGIGSCYVNQIHWLTDNEKMRSVLHSLGMKEDEFICTGAVFGYSAAGDLPPVERFGNPVTYIK